MFKPLLNQPFIPFEFLFQHHSNLLRELLKHTLHLFGLHQQITPPDFVIKECFRQLWVLQTQSLQHLNVNQFCQLLSDHWLVSFRSLHELLYVLLLVVVIVVSEEFVVVEGKVRIVWSRDGRMTAGCCWV